MSAHDRNATRLTTCLAVVLVLVACKRNASTTKGDVADAAPSPAVDFSGRCVIETAGAPYQSIFFFPKKGEMFFYLGSKGAFRVPLTIVAEEPRKLDFTFMWSEKDELPATRTGRVSAVGDKWQFELDTLKGSTCRPAVAPDFYKLLPELGFPAGRWEDRKTHLGIVIAADAQEWLLSESKQNTTIHYRVLEHGANGTVVTTYGNTPGDGDDEGWAASRLVNADNGIVQEIGDMQMHYTLVNAAPILK
jgi:hypothetical protein